MTSTTKTPGTTDGTAELAYAVAQRRFHRLAPNWLDVPTLTRD
ncbi:hypothetical protein ACFWIB_41340 [Streptomyces sp. NPDC127051]